MSCENKFWLENPPDLICSYNIIPMKNMDLEEQMNSLTRLAILLSVPTVAITNVRFSAIILVMVIVFIIIFYYVKRKNGIKKGEMIENFEIQCNKREKGEKSETLSSMANAGIAMEPTMKSRLKNQIIYNELSAVQPTNPSCNVDIYCGAQTQQDLHDYNFVKDSNIKIQYNLNKKRQIPATETQEANYFGGNADRFSSKYNLPTGAGPDFFSYNHALAGNANPRTLIPPIITPKAYDSKYWRANELINFNQINAKSAVDTFASGYDVSNCCNSYCTGCDNCVVNGNDPKEENFNQGQWGKEDDINRMSDIPMDPLGNMEMIENDRGLGTLTPDMTRGPTWSDLSGQIQNDIPYGEMINPEDSSKFTREGSNRELRENFFMFPSGSDTVYSNKSKSTFQPPCNGYQPALNTPKYSIPYLEGAESFPQYLGPIKSGSVNLSCGYNPDNVNVNLPTNQLAGPCQKNEIMAEYNKNLYTNTIQPGIYSRSQINQPINANIGISFQQQLEPVTCKNDGSSLEYILHDPSIAYEMREGYNDCAPIAPGGESRGNVIANYDIYDPRHFGYGTSYRSYIDDMTGQPRYAYDDINAIRMPNYVTRNQLDFSPNFPHYGTMAEKQNGLGEMKKKANNLFLKNSLEQRNNLMERYQEKINTITSQRRQAPINRTSFHRAR